MLYNLYLDCSRVTATSGLVCDNFDLSPGGWFSANVTAESFNLNRLALINPSTPAKFIRPGSSLYHIVKGAALYLHKGCPRMSSGHNGTQPLIVESLDIISQRQKLFQISSRS